MEDRIRARFMARSKDAPKRPGEEPARPRGNSRPKSPGVVGDTPGYMGSTARSEGRKAAFNGDEKRRADTAQVPHERLSRPQVHDAAAETFYEAPSSFQQAAAKSAPKGTAAARGGFAKKGNRSRFSTYGGMYTDTDPLSTKHNNDRAAAASLKAAQRKGGRVSPKAGANAGMTPKGHSPKGSGIMAPGFASTPPQGRPNRAGTIERARAAAQGLPAPNPHVAPMLKPQYSRPSARSVADVVDVRDPPSKAAASAAQPALGAGRAGVARRGSALLAAALSGIDEGTSAAQASPPPPPPPPPSQQGQAGGGASPMPQRPKRSPPKPPGMS